MIIFENHIIQQGLERIQSNLKFIKNIIDTPEFKKYKSLYESTHEEYRELIGQITWRGKLNDKSEVELIDDVLDLDEKTLKILKFLEEQI